MVFPWSEPTHCIISAFLKFPSNNEIIWGEVFRSFHDEEDIARTAAAKKKRFEGKDTLKISK